MKKRKQKRNSPCFLVKFFFCSPNKTKQKKFCLDIFDKAKTFFFCIDDDYNWPCVCVYDVHSNVSKSIDWQKCNNNKNGKVFSEWKKKEINQIRLPGFFSHLLMVANIIFPIFNTMMMMIMCAILFNVYGLISFFFVVSSE